MLPVPAPADVWARAQREFASSRIERFPLRARLLDMLEQLDRGHLLALMGSTTPRVWLNGCPDIALLAGVLFSYDYVQIAGRHREIPHVATSRCPRPGDSSCARAGRGGTPCRSVSGCGYGCSAEAAGRLAVPCQDLRCGRGAYSIAGIAPPPGGAGFSAITQSVVRIRLATDAACCRPSRVTLVGSMTPIENMSPYCSLARL